MSGRHRCPSGHWIEGAGGRVLRLLTTVSGGARCGVRRGLRDAGRDCSVVERMGQIPSRGGERVALRESLASYPCQQQT